MSTRIIRKILIGVVAIGSLVLAPAASAEIHSPADGATFQATDTVYFDWAWGSDEYATSWIGVARSPDGPWSPLPEKWLMDCSDGVCSPWFSSHAYIPASRIGVGTWWWRLCNKSIYGEDDKCALSTEGPRMLTITAPPPTPIPTPAPVTTPAPAPAPKPVIHPKPLPTLSQGSAVSYLKTALHERFRRAFPARRFQARCTRTSSTSFACRPQWAKGKTRWTGTAHVWLTPSTGQHHVTTRIRKGR